MVPESKAVLEAAMQALISEYGREEGTSIFKEVLRRIASTGEDGATVADWMAMMQVVTIERHPEILDEWREYLGARPV